MELKVAKLRAERETGRNGRWTAIVGCLAALLTAAPATAAAQATATPLGRLHVASPDWRDQVVYFVMTDRFDDGDPRNDDQGTGEFRADDPARYNGGDLAGIERRLDYIRGLGATAVWVTPPVANRWWDATARHGGYHGYWAENFMAVDAHLGKLGDYQRLSRKLHGAGMLLVQDIVLNHTGNYFDYAGGWDPGDPGKFYLSRPDGRGRTAPTQWPFSLNDPRDPRQRAAGIYHWTPAIVDYKDATQVHDFQMGSLDDLDSANPRVRQALRESYGYWIREAGVDAFRIDTAFYVPPDALADFMTSADAKAPGMLAVARSTGRKAFHVFGEGFASDQPYEETQARRIDGLMRGSDGSTLLPGMLNFPLYATIGDVFARGRPTAEMSYRLLSMMRVHAQPWLMPTFLDNHDVDRFLAGGSEAGLKQALLLMLTVPGIPTIYYGTEQGFTVPRAAMFRAGSGSGGIDHFDTAAPLYRFLHKAIALRRGNRVFSRGMPTILRDNRAGPGVLAYRMDWQGRSAIIAFNTSDSPALLDAMPTGTPAGSLLKGAFAIDGAATDLVAGEGGHVTLQLAPRAGSVWIAGGPARRAVPAQPVIELQATGRPVEQADFQLQGRAPGLQRLLLVVDGDLASASAVSVAGNGDWHATVDTSRMIDPAIGHRVVAWSADTGAASAAHEFRVSRRWTRLAELADPVGDDQGPAGRYRYPTDPGWGSHRQMDIQHVSVEGAGGAMRLVLTMNEISTPWNPPNGFDHVAFNIFLQVPGTRPASAVMPLQNAAMPAGMRWNYRLRAHGWSNAFFNAAGAGAAAEGTPATPAPSIAVDAAARTVSFTFSSAALGGLRDLSGVRVYVNTWDYDGGYRLLAAQAGATILGGGDGRGDPLLMDDTDVITLP